ncbi:hypothetical protein C0992_011523, partial [Termitomyces sp. T32_za158]
YIQSAIVRPCFGRSLQGQRDLTAKLTMKFDISEAELTTTIHLQRPSERNDPVTLSPGIDSTTILATLGPRPTTPLKTPIQCPHNIPRSKYKGPHYPTQNSWTPLDLSEDEKPPPPVSLNALDIKIIGAALFTRILQGGTQAFQLHITPVLLEEHLRAEASPLEQRIEEEILHKVVPTEYYEFANVFSESSMKKLPYHWLSGNFHFGTSRTGLKRSGWSFVINTRLGNSLEILSALIDSGATKTFISDRLALPYQDIAKPLELQLFGKHPAPSGPITKSHSKDTNTTLIDSGTLNIKIIGAAPFADILQEGAQAFQLHITPMLPKEHLRAEASPSAQATEEETLNKVVPLEYHKFANVFSEGSAKELPHHCTYDHKINFLEEGTSPPFGKI